MSGDTCGYTIEGAPDTGWVEARDAAQYPSGLRTLHREPSSHWGVPRAESGLWNVLVLGKLSWEM
jgi:hypothetical protein